MSDIEVARDLIAESALRDADQTRDAMEHVRDAHGLADVPTFLAPVLLPKSAWAQLDDVARRVHAAVERVLVQWFVDGQHQDRVDLPAGVDALISPTVEGASLSNLRLDVLFDPSAPDLSAPGSVKVVEVQAGDPSGAGWTDLFWLGLESTPGVRAARERVSVSSPSLVLAHEAMARSVMTRWLSDHSRRAPAEPRAIFLCAEDSFVRSDHEALAWRYIRRGWRALVRDPRDYDPSNEPAWLYVRDTHDELVTPAFAPRTRLLRERFAADAALVLAPFRDVLADDKRVLELMWEQADDALADVLLETRTLAPDDAPERAGLVLKPADGYGGFGVVLGDHVDDATWTDALADARERPTVVQRHHPIPRVTLPTLDGGEQELFCTLSLWLHGGRLSGAYARASGDPVVNVHQGGGIVPVAWVG